MRREGARALVLVAAAVWGGGCEPSVPAADDAATPDAAAPALQAAGGPCASAEDCRAGLECFTGPTDARAWPGGYCTRSCATDDDCTGGARCGPAYYDASGPVLRCLAPCERVEGERGGCRDGYQCHYDGVCIVGCETDEQCAARDADPPGGRVARSEGATCERASGRCILGATPGARHGDACTQNSDCGPESACFGAAGCLNSQCDLGGARACPEGAVCTPIDQPWDVRSWLCLPRCLPGVDGRNRAGDACPTDWGCRPPDASLPAVDASGFCLPGAPQNDATTFGACTSHAECANPLGFSVCVSSGTSLQCTASFCGASALAGVPELACPAGGVCTFPNPDEFDPPLRPADRRRVELGVCLSGVTP